MVTERVSRGVRRRRHNRAHHRSRRPVKVESDSKLGVQRGGVDAKTHAPARDTALRRVVRVQRRLGVNARGRHFVVPRRGARVCIRRPVFFVAGIVVAEISSARAGLVVLRVPLFGFEHARGAFGGVPRGERRGDRGAFRVDGDRVLLLESFLDAAEIDERGLHASGFLLRLFVGDAARDVVYGEELTHARNVQQRDPVGCPAGAEASHAGQSAERVQQTHVRAPSGIFPILLAPIAASLDVDVRDGGSRLDDLAPVRGGGRGERPRQPGQSVELHRVPADAGAVQREHAREARGRRPGGGGGDARGHVAARARRDAGPRATSAEAPKAEAREARAARTRASRRRRRVRAPGRPRLARSDPPTCARGPSRLACGRASARAARRDARRAPARRTRT